MARVPDPLEKLLSGAGSGDGGAPDVGGDSSELDAAKDMLAAIKRNDAGGLSLALKRHYEACKASEDEPETDDDDYGDEG